MDDNDLLRNTLSDARDALEYILRDYDRGIEVTLGIATLARQAVEKANAILPTTDTLAPLDLR
jgi:hypothetical protein